MGRSQKHLIKATRKKSQSQEKRQARKKRDEKAVFPGGSEIDWDSAPVNNTLTQDEERQKARQRNQNKD